MLKARGPSMKNLMEMKMVVDLAPLAGVKRSGIYALSVPCMKEPKIIKIGKAKDLRARIDQYQLYYPFGVAVELLWNFPKNTRDVDFKLQQMERALLLRRREYGIDSNEVLESCRRVADLCNSLAMQYLQQGQARPPPTQRAAAAHSLPRASACPLQTPLMHVWNC